MDVRRFVTLVVSFCLVLALGLTRVDETRAQADSKKEAQPPKAEPAPKDAAKTDSAKTEPAKKDETPKAEAPQPTEPPLPSIPPEVQAKIDAARKAVAEAIVAAQDAGLVETSIDPPPILDILITGRATDSRTLKNTTAKKPYAVSPEVLAPGLPVMASWKASTTLTTFASFNRVPGSSSGTISVPGFLSSTSRKSARPRARRRLPRKRMPSQRKQRKPKNPRRPKNLRRRMSPRSNDALSAPGNSRQASVRAHLRSFGATLFTTTCVASGRVRWLANERDSPGLPQCSSTNATYRRLRACSQRSATLVAAFG